MNGVVDSGSKPSAVPERASATVPGSATVRDTFSTAGGPAIQQRAAKGYKLATPSVTSSRLAHTDASLQIRVADTDALSSATSRATKIATSLGGYAKSVDYRTPKAAPARRTSSCASRRRT